MRPVANYTAERFSRNAASLCTCWRIIRADGTESGFTDHDTDLQFTGTTFHAMEGAAGSALEATSSLSVDNADIVGVLGTERLDRAALDAGLYDGAEIQVWRVDWEDVSARLLLKTGMFGEVHREGEGYRVEFRSLKHRLNQVSGRIYGRTCDAALGDSRCGVDLSDANLRYEGVLVSSSGTEFLIETGGTPGNGHFVHGTLIVKSGILNGVVRAIRDHGRNGTNDAITLWEALPAPLIPGTSVVLLAGCDKRLSTCRDKFSNTLNFQGFPYIPGSDVLTATARPGDGT